MKRVVEFSEKDVRDFFVKEGEAGISDLMSWLEKRFNVSSEDASDVRLMVEDLVETGKIKEKNNGEYEFVG